MGWLCLVGALQLTLSAFCQTEHYGYIWTRILLSVLLGSQLPFVAESRQQLKTFTLFDLYKQREKLRMSQKF